MKRTRNRRMRRNKTRHRRQKLRRGGMIDTIKICNTNGLKGQTYHKIHNTNLYTRDGDTTKKYTYAQISQAQQDCLDRGVLINDL